MKWPRSFDPWSSRCSSPSSTAARPSVPACSTNVPRSQTITSPAPYPPDGITPSKSRYSIGWSSTCTARWRTFGSSVTPFGDRPAHEHAVDLEPEVVVESSGPVALHDERGAPARAPVAPTPRGLRRPVEVTLGVVAREPGCGSGLVDGIHGPSPTRDRRLECPRPTGAVEIASGAMTEPGDLRAGMQGDLRTAMKARDRVRVAVLRSALGAIANAEAVPTAARPNVDGTNLVTEVPRRELDEADVLAIVVAELDELTRDAERLPRDHDARILAELEARIAVLEGYLPEPRRRRPERPVRAGP